MSRAFLPNCKNYDTKIKAMFKEAGLTSYDKTFGARKNDPIFGVAARFVRYLSGDVKRFLELTDNSGVDKSIFQGFPLITLGKDPTTLRVYTNLTIDVVEDSKLRYCSWAMHYEVLDSFMNSVKEDLAVPHKAKAWETVHRSIRRLGKFEEMPTSRALARYTAYSKNGATGAEIDAVATIINDARKPLELIWATKIEDYAEMYRTGAKSCMSWTNGEMRNWQWMPTKFGLHPTSFFALYPYAKGVYFKQKGVVAARTICYQHTDNKWYYGTVYTNGNSKLHQLFLNQLHEQGIESLKKIHSDNFFRREATFSFKPFLGDDMKYMPLPFMDNLRTEINFTYNEATDLITVECKGKGNINDGYGQGGFVNVKHMKGIICACGKTWRGKTIQNLTPSSDGNTMFCGATCASRGGYISATRNDGTHVYSKPEDAIPDAMQPGIYFTNMQAAKANGCLPVMDGLYAPTDEERVTQTGNVVIDEQGIHLGRMSGPLIRQHMVRGRNVTAARQTKGDDGAFLFYNEDYGTYTLIQAKGRIKINLTKVRTVILDENATLIAA